MAEIFRVQGKSMLPTLRSDDFIFSARARELKRGDLVVAQTQVGLVVKRVDKLSDNYIYLRGDNSNSESFICHQPLETSAVVGKVYFRFRFPLSFAAL